MLPFPTNYFFENDNNNVNLTGSLKSQEDLHVFIPNNPGSLVILTALLRIRTRIDQEFWLVDITPWKTVENAAQALKDLKVDIDDNLYWYIPSPDLTSILIWEAYRISPSQKGLTVLYFNTWTSTAGFQDIIEDKWTRRRNLQVHKN